MSEAHTMKITVEWTSHCGRPFCWYHVFKSCIFKGFDVLSMSSAKVMYASVVVLVDVCCIDVVYIV